MRLNIDTAHMMTRVTLLVLAILVHAPWWVYVMVFFSWFGLTFKKEL